MSIAFPGDYPALCGPRCCHSRACRIPRPTAARSDEDDSLSPVGASENIDLSTLTLEQLAVVFAELAEGEVLKVVAGAGTGKTRCLRAYSEQHPHEKILHMSVSKCEQG